ncbi:Cof-type HAD-IIB family hydrolase [Ligilactobacillus sp. LYQ139]|uniref:Cof-type HAD-IIB family hydrolase n=1 Tax=Ligilactobacillus sp. LYQ139 TaxID=3378800 RepID=UPI00385413B7
MQSVPFRAVAVDMDGTFLDDHKRFDEDRFARVLAALQEHDIQFIVASGNQYERLAQYFAAFPAVSYVAENGAHITGPGMEPIRYFVPEDVVTTIVIRCLDLGLAPMVCGVRHAYVAQSAPVVLRKRAHYYCPNLVEVGALAPLPEKTIYQVTVNVALGDEQRVVATLTRGLKQWVTACPSGNGSIDLVAPIATKAQGLATLLAHSGRQLADLIAFGDGENDLEMLRAAGISYAMANGSPVVRRTAQLIAPNNNEAGVLQVLERYLGLD